MLCRLHCRPNFRGNQLEYLEHLRQLIAAEGDGQMAQPQGLIGWEE
jgi:hypothetical protein